MSGGGSPDKKHRDESGIADPDLREYAAIAADKYPWPDRDGPASVTEWRSYVSKNASELKKVLDAAILDLSNREDALFSASRLFPLGLHDRKRLTAVIDAFLEYLHKRYAPKTWASGAQNLELFSTSSGVAVVATAGAIAMFCRRRVLPWQEHNLPKCSEMLDTLKDVKVLVLYGSSGAGKTYGSFSAGRRVAQAKAIVYCQCSSNDLDKGLEARYFAEPDDKEKKELRNKLAFKLVMSVVGQAIPETHRNAPPASEDAEKQDMVLVLDELGCAPYLVRGIINRHDALRAAIKKLVNCTGKVHLIIAGTGVEGLAHDIGSSLSDYTAFQMRPHVWPTLSQHVDSSIRALVSNDSSPTGGLIRTLVSNARCAALFAEESTDWYTQSGGTVTETTMAMAAAKTVLRYRKLNGLERLNAEQLVAVIASAMAAQLSEADKPDLLVDIKDLKTRYGVLVDNGVASKDVVGKIVAPTHHPRYEVEPAFEAMLRFIIGMANRAPTGEGFEEAFADFMALGVIFAGLPARDESLARDLFSRESVQDMLEHCNVLGDVPNGWSAPLTLVSWLRSHVPGGGGRSVAVETHQATCKIERGNDEAMRKVRATISKIATKPDPAAARNALVIMNGKQAQGADVIGYMPGSATIDGKGLLIMCQEKLYPKSKLHQHELLFELHKMGCDAEIVEAGAWAHTVAGAELGEVTAIDGEVIAKGPGNAFVQRETLVEVIATDLSKSRGTFAQWLQARIPHLAQKAVAAQGRARAAQAALREAFVDGLNAAPSAPAEAFVVAVYGNVAELSPAVKALLLGSDGNEVVPNVLLLHAKPATAATAPAPASAAEAPSASAARLRGFYPVSVAHDGTAVQLCTIPVPTEPPRDALPSS